MAMGGADSDDELTIVKAKPPPQSQGLVDFYRLLKKPKVEGGVSTSPVGDAGSAGQDIGIRSARWPPVSPDLQFYKIEENVKSLEAVKLLGFISASLVEFEIQEQLVAEFVSNYQFGTRGGVVRGKRLELTSEVVSRALKLPNCGVSCTSLKVEEYPIAGCFSTPNPVSSIGSETETPIRVLKSELSSDWREMVDFVQRWLFLDVDVVNVDVGVVVATMALFRHRVQMNWAKLVVRRLHQLVEDAKTHEVRGEKEFEGGYFITKMWNEVNAIDLAHVKMETDEGTSQSVLPGVAPAAQGPDYYRKASLQLEMLSAHPSVFEDYAALTEKYDVLLNEHQSLQTEAEQLKKVIADARDEHAKMVEQLKKREADSARESAAMVSLQRELEVCKDEAVDLKKRYADLNTKHIDTRLNEVSQKQRIEELTVHSQNVEEELNAIRKGKGIEDADSSGIVQRGYMNIEDLLELSYVIPPAQNLERAYTYDRYILFMLNGLVMGQTLSSIEFEQIWEWAERDKQEDLLVEIIVRGDLQLADYVSAFWLIGDLGVRLLRYYRQLEETQTERRRLEAQCAENVRQPKCEEWGRLVAYALANDWNNLPIEEWQSLLSKFLDGFELEGWLLEMIRLNQDRLVRTRFADVHPSEYFYTYRDTKIRLERFVNAKTFSQLLPFEVHSHARFKNKYNWQVAPEAVVGMPAQLDSWSFGTNGTITDDQFLGKWENLFGTVDDRSDTLLWEALLWIGKDYNHEQQPLTKPIEALITSESNLRLDYGEVPEEVAQNPYWCSTSQRRYKWRIDARLDTVWYNWPVIPGVWTNWKECVTSYTQFWQEHKTHRDPVCFRAAIFCKALAEWCQFFKIIIDPRLGGRMLQDGELYARLNYNCCRKMRLLELMFMMQFLQGAHNNFIGDKKANRRGAMESFVHRDRDGTVKEERANWRALSLECDELNAEARRRGESRTLYQMPLQWTPGCGVIPIAYDGSSHSARPVKKEAAIPIGDSSKK